MAAMAKLSAESYHASATERFLHQQGLEQIRVRKYGALLNLESGPAGDPVRHARLRRVSVQYWTPEMATHRGQWERTGLWSATSAGV
jgi:hypothetical protein